MLVLCCPYKWQLLLYRFFQLMTISKSQGSIHSLETVSTLNADHTCYGGFTTKIIRFTSKAVLSGFEMVSLISQCILVETNQLPQLYKSGIRLVRIKYFTAHPPGRPIQIESNLGITKSTDHCFISKVSFLCVTTGH